MRQIILLKHLDHPNIPKLFDIFMEYKDVLMIKEIVDAWQKTQHKLDEMSIFDVGRQLLEGVMYLHSKRIMHGDIVGNNVFGKLT